MIKLWRGIFFLKVLCYYAATSLAAFAKQAFECAALIFNFNYQSTLAA